MFHDCSQRGSGNLGPPVRMLEISNHFFVAMCSAITVIFCPGGFELQERWPHDSEYLYSVGKLLVPNSLDGEVELGFNFDLKQR